MPPCEVRGCPFRALPSCPDHSQKYPRGFHELDRMMRRRPVLPPPRVPKGAPPRNWVELGTAVRAEPHRNADEYVTKHRPPQR